MEQWHELYRAENLLEAALLQGMLGNIGIETHIDGQYCAGAAGELPMEVIQVSLKVNLYAWERAKLALKDYQRNQKLEWTCFECGEINPGSFEYCWSCQCENAPK
ncbi:putative signal transducing protein [Agarivorans gilvus]|jgi:hypothetical protein|uniref:RanBP2-type domain-containing protein n=1 Tax=Agarivorans gilvus TaxID=680279 RepID=A0ABQ1I210_9ALTE|nr:DUF2007 domain-containing protein [Agarivorans gilvus]GGB07436.1 hypothetical protein GCM10007414_20980 [Agarivorans gilvus]